MYLGPDTRLALEVVVEVDAEAVVVAAVASVGAPVTGPLLVVAVAAAVDQGWVVDALNSEQQSSSSQILPFVQQNWFNSL